ncbi:MAG: DNA replication/repair protein RecF [Acidobacteriota bacterium]
MRLRRFETRGFRNLAPQTLTVPGGVIAVIGDNGVGKTNLLEAITVFGNLQSFRPGAPTNWVRHGSGDFVLAGTVDRDGSEVELRQEARVGRAVHRRLWRGARRLGSAEFLDLFPVAALSSHDRQIVWGGPDERRKLLDRMAFYAQPASLGILQRYRRALRQRNALLTGGGRPEAFEAFEADLSALGARVVEARLGAVAELERSLESELRGLGWSLARPNLRYHCPDGLAPADPATLAARLRAEYARRRREEKARGHTMVGPHRHDLALTVTGSPAREVLSAGQGKLMATAFRLAAVALFERARGRMPLVVFDDVDAEFDAGVLDRVFARLGRARQCFVSSAHEQMVLGRVPVAEVWRIADGRVVTAARGE